MKLALSLLLGSACLVSNARAGSSKTFNLATETLVQVQNMTEHLTESIKAWDGKSLQDALTNIHNPGNATASYVVNATQVLKDYPTVFDLTQAFKIGSPTQRLAYAVNASIAALIRRKGDFDAAQITPIVAADVQTLLNATQDFADLIISYVLPNLQPVANNMNMQIVNSLQQGLDCFHNVSAETTCTTGIANSTRTYNLAVQYNAMKPDGAPYY